MQKEGFISVPGGKVFYTTFGDGNSKNAPLIAVHGGPGFSHDTLEVLAPLAEHRQFILYDQLGCGRSDRPNKRNLWTLQRYVSELDAIIDYFSLDTYHLLGHSFGASIALEHGLKQPSGLLSLILSSPLVSVKDWLADTAIRKKELPTAVQVTIDEHEAAGTIESDDYQAATKLFNSKFLCRLDPKPPIYQKALKNFNVDIYRMPIRKAHVKSNITWRNLRYCDFLAIPSG